MTVQQLQPKQQQIGPNELLMAIGRKVVEIEMLSGNLQAAQNRIKELEEQIAEQSKIDRSDAKAVKAG